MSVRANPWTEDLGYSQSSDGSHQRIWYEVAIQFAGADAVRGGVTMIAVLSPDLPVAPVCPVGPAGPAGPGTATGVAGTLTTAGLSQAAILNDASTDMRI